MSELSREPPELDRWAELYGHPEEWVKKAQAAHGRAEKAEVERDRYRQALKEIVGQDPVELALDPQWAQRIAKGALDA